MDGLTNATSITAGPTEAWWSSYAAQTLAGAAATTVGAALAVTGAPPAGMALGLAGAGLLAFAVRRQAAQARDSAERSVQHAAVAHRTLNVHPVTGLPTREDLLAAMQADFEAGGRVGLLGAIRFADYDRLAAFDPSGANAVLKLFADRLTSAAQRSHVVAQVDRDCFCIWFRGEELGLTAAAEMRAIAYVAGQELDGGPQPLTPAIEIGVARRPEDGGDGAQLLLRVISALGRPAALDLDTPLPAPPSIEAARNRFRLEQDVARAIAEDQLSMVFQPVIDAAAGRLLGAEALLRWEHPQLGPVSPSIFVPIIESMGLSDRYGLWVLNAACKEAARWRREGLGGLKVAVNLSARQLLDQDLATKIARTLQRHGVDPRMLELELTETAAMADAARTRSLFVELRAMGISIAIDDFGAGYSSLSYLKNLPFDKLKIDREFVTAVQSRRDSQAICKALIELGRGLDLVVLAEGVETPEEVAALRGLGCTVFQGYHFSRPLSGDDFRRMAREGAWKPAPARRQSAPAERPDPGDRRLFNKPSPLTATGA